MGQKPAGPPRPSGPGRVADRTVPGRGRPHGDRPRGAGSEMRNRAVLRGSPASDGIIPFAGRCREGHASANRCPDAPGRSDGEVPGSAVPETGIGRTGRRCAEGRTAPSRGRSGAPDHPPRLPGAFPGPWSRPGGVLRGIARGLPRRTRPRGLGPPPSGRRSMRAPCPGPAAKSGPNAKRVPKRRRPARLATEPGVGRRHPGSPPEREAAARLCLRISQFSHAGVPGNEKSRKNPVPDNACAVFAARCFLRRGLPGIKRAAYPHRR